jgi:TPR repeat protein
LPAAQYNLATLYLQGRGTPIDPQAAFHWYEAAAKAGYADAEYMLGECYRTGAGTKRDGALALSWYLKAARNGSSAAQLMAASIYYTGEGWRRELPKAMVWAELARLNGEAQAVGLTVQISRDLNDAQKALAVEKARLCRDSKYQDCPE